MGLKRYAVEQTGVLELRDANDEPMKGDDGSAMKITMYGPGSKQYAQAQAWQSNRLIDKLKRKGKTEETAEEKAREQAEFLARVTKDFSSNMATDYPGKEGRDLFMDVYGDREIGFVAEQAGRFVNDWANFSKPSTTSSASTSGNQPG